MTEQMQKDYSLKENLKNDWYLFLIMLIPLVIALYLYPKLPEQIPTHWNIDGKIDDYSSKAFAAWFFPLLNLALYFFMLIAPIIDPRRRNYFRFAGAYRIFRVFFSVFMSSIYLVTLLIALGYDIRVDLFIKIAVALLFMVIGNFMGKFQHNYFVGIKTPWTLANEEVWRKTHRLGGKIWTVSGAILFILGFFTIRWVSYLYFAVIIIMAIIPMLASYLFYRQLQN